MYPYLILTTAGTLASTDKELGGRDTGGEIPMANDRYRRGGRAERGERRSPEQVEKDVKRRMRGEEVLIPVDGESERGRSTATEHSGGGQQQMSLRYGGESRHQASHVPRERPSRQRSSQGGRQSSQRQSSQHQPSQQTPRGQQTTQKRTTQKQPTQESRHNLRYGGETRHPPSHARESQGRGQFSQQGQEYSPQQQLSPQHSHQQTPPKQPHQQPAEHRQATEQHQPREHRQMTGHQRPAERRQTPGQRSAGRQQPSGRRYTQRLEESKRRTEGQSGEQIRTGPAGTPERREQRQRGSETQRYGSRQSQGRGPGRSRQGQSQTRSRRSKNQGRQSRNYELQGRTLRQEQHQSRSRDVGTQQPDFGMSRKEQRRAPDVGTRRSHSGEVGESGISGSERPGQFEGRHEEFHSEGGRHGNRY